MKKLLVLLVVGTLAFSVHAQSRKRLVPGKMYEPGDTLYAPRDGFTTIIPAGWTGSLPRDTEVFLLNSMQNQGEIFIFDRKEGNLEDIKAAWLKGTDLNETIKLKAKPDAAIVDGALMTEVYAEGPSINKSFRGYAATKCNPAGPCITAISIVPAQFYEAAKTGIQELMKKGRFDEPKNISLHADLNWKEYLKGKMLITFADTEVGSKENIVHLCSDGTFKARIRKKGMIKQEENPDYSGRMSGTWEASGVGEQGVVTLNFKKQDKATFPIQIKDEKVTVNGERYFVAQSDECPTKK
jgi:hypothetical protein